MRPRYAIFLWILLVGTSLSAKTRHCMLRVHAEAKRADSALFSTSVRAHLSGTGVAIQRIARIIEAAVLALPTDNHALFHGGGPDFYQHVERDYKGVKSTPWEGGQYGFVRDPIQTAAGMVYTRFHEGIDIRPLQRDTRGDPVDDVHAIAN